MKKSIVVVALMVLASMSQADLVITEVMSSSSHTNSAGNGDWWELFNSGAEAVDLTGYSWDDAGSSAPGVADFNGLTIHAGQAMIICQETIGAEESWRAIWGIPSSVAVINLGNTEFQNFSNSGDEIYVWNPLLELVASVSFGTATTGFSFEWDAAGNSLGLSVIGENGAFQATEMGGTLRDIGSPGMAIPEPTTLSLIGLGGLLIAIRRRISG